MKTLFLSWYFKYKNRKTFKFKLFAEEIDKNLEKAVDTIKPPIFWKDKPIFNKQLKKWNIKN